MQKISVLEASKILDIPQGTLNHWCRHGKIREAPRDDVRYRKFYLDDIMNLKSKLIPSHKRRCTECNLVDDKEKFPRGRNRCKECYHNYSIERQKNDRRFNKIKRRASKYKIKEEELKTMIENSNYQCEICKKKLVLQELCIDHNHDTKKVRGLLCRECNVGMGLFKDDIFLLQNTISYLNKYDDQTYLTKCSPYPTP